MGPRRCLGPPLLVRRVSYASPSVAVVVHDPAAWHDYIDPISTGIIAMIDARQNLIEEASGLPAADSRAMAEIADIGRRFPLLLERTNAVEHALVLANVCLTAAEDHFKAMCRLYLQEEAVLYADRVLLRAGLEAAGRALWLLDPDIDGLQRAERGLTVWIQSRYVVAEGFPDRRGATREHREALRERVKAAGLSWTTKKDTPPWVGAEKFPSATKILQYLLPHDPEVDELDLGKTAQSFLSLYVHANPSALFAVAEEMDTSASPVRLPVGRLASSAETVNFLLGYLTLGYWYAAGCQLDLLGWDRTGWDSQKFELAGQMRVRFPSRNA